jgi:hypothetical protein
VEQRVSGRCGYGGDAVRRHRKMYTESCSSKKKIYREVVRNVTEGRRCTGR